MEILIGLFIIGVIIILYNIYSSITEIPEEGYLVPPKIKSKEKPVKEHFEDTLAAEDFITKEHVAEVNDHVKEIVGVKLPKKHLQKRERKTLKHIVKDK